MLLKDVWGYKFVPTTNLIDVHIGHLRQKVDGLGETPLINAVRGAGFILRSSVEHITTHKLATDHAPAAN